VDSRSAATMDRSRKNCVQFNTYLAGSADDQNARFIGETFGHNGELRGLQLDSTFILLSNPISMRCAAMDRGESSSAASFGTDAEALATPPDMMRSRKRYSYSLCVRGHKSGWEAGTDVGPMRSNKTPSCCGAPICGGNTRDNTCWFSTQRRYQGGPGVVETAIQTVTARWTRLSSIRRTLGDSPAIAQREKEIGKKIDCIAIDEGQFVNELFLFTRRLLDAVTTC